jgi:hypothetical protein
MGRRKKWAEIFLVSFSLAILFSLRLLKISFPPNPYFDEPLRFQAVQEISLGLFPQDFHAHHPLAHLLMVFPFSFLNRPSLSPPSRPLPFHPKDVAVTSDQLILLSPKGLSLYLLPFSHPTLSFLCYLPEECEKLFPLSYGFLAVLSTHNNLLLLKGKKLIRSFKLAEKPEGVFLFRDGGEYKLVMVFNRYLSTLSSNGEKLWEKNFDGQITACFADEGKKVLALSLGEPLPFLLLLSLNGDLKFSLPLPEKVTSFVLLHQPSLVATTEGWGRYILEVLFSEGRRARFAPKMGWRFFEVFPENLRNLVASPESPSIFSLGSNTLYIFNSSTGLLEGIYPLPFHPKSVFPLKQGNGAFLLSDSGEIFLFSRPIPVGLCRLSPAFFGGFLLPLITFLFSLRLTNSFPHSLLALWLVGLDPLLFWLSRTLMLDIFVSTFSLSSFLLAHFSLSYKDIRRYLFLSLTGLSLGLAFSCKLNGLFCLPALFFLLSPFPLTLRILSLLVIPLLTYISVWEIVREFGGYSWSQIFHAHYVMLTFQSQLREVHPTSAPFWMWVLGKGSVLLFHQHISDSFGSWIFLPIPFWLWLLGIFAAVKEMKGMGKNLLKDFAHLGFWTLWLLWVLSPRPVHSYYFSQSIPFLCLIAVRSIGFKGRIFFLWLLSFLWLSPTIYGFPLPLNLGHRLSNPLMGWSPYILSFLTK